MVVLYVSLAMSVLTGIDYLRRFVAVLGAGGRAANPRGRRDRRLPPRPLPAAVAARRIGAGRLPCWLASPGAGQLAIEREYLACDPVAVVRGDSSPTSIG